MPDDSPTAEARTPDYDLEDFLVADSPQRMKALGDPLRLLLLDLVLERAMTVTELAARVGRARGSVAHHVDLLVTAGLLRVVRTRRVRAVTESFYGRTARTIGITDHGDDLPFFQAARAEADVEAMRGSSDECGGFTMRHARIPVERAREFFERVNLLALEFTALGREGDREFAFLGAVFPTTRRVAATVGPDADGGAETGAA
jgi:DNA-binding transcriptional ArsR family regulator